MKNKNVIVAVLVIVIICAIALFYYQSIYSGFAPASCDGYEDYADYQCVAFGTGDVSECEKMDNQSQVGSCRDEFYLGVAIKSKDRAACQNIDDGYVKSGCILIADDDISKCDDQESDDMKNICKAILSGDLMSCKDINDLGIKRDCVRITVLKAAFDAKNPTLCNAISDDLSKTKCIAFANQNANACWEAAIQECRNWLI